MDFPGFSLDLGMLKKSKQPDSLTTYDLLILGGGPAAMSAAIYAARKMLNLAILTKDFGGQMLKASGVENWPGIQSILGKDLAGRFQEHLKTFDIPVVVDVTITEVSREGEVFKVKADDGRTYSGKTVIIATGKRHRSLNVPGEKELSGKGVAYCATCDAPFFKNKRVVVVGGGNSAFMTALDLLKVEAEVVLVNFIEGWQADEILQERVKQFNTVRFLDYHRLISIKGEDRVTEVIIGDRKTEKQETIPADGVFVEIGLIAGSDLVEELAELNEHGELVVDCACRTSMDGLLGAGDVTTVPYKQVIISAGEGAKAALSAYDYLTKKGLI